MPSTSSAPCTVPSSPKRPCSAMNTRAKPSRLSSDTWRSAGSNACASTPCSRSALSTALPDRNEISRSAEGPPISTATFPNSRGLTRLPPCLLRANTARRRVGSGRDSRRAIPTLRAGPLAAGSHGLPDDPDLGLEDHAGLFGHHPPHVLDQRLDVGRARAALRVDDEVGVLLRHPRAA